MVSLAPPVAKEGPELRRRAARVAVAPLVGLSRLGLTALDRLIRRLDRLAAIKASSMPLAPVP